jgi:hypothetical protein
MLSASRSGGLARAWTCSLRSPSMRTEDRMAWLCLTDQIGNSVYINMDNILSFTSSGSLTTLITTVPLQEGYRAIVVKEAPKAIALSLADAKVSPPVPI